MEATLESCSTSFEVIARSSLRLKLSSMDGEPDDEGIFPESCWERWKRWLIPTRADSRNDTCAKMASVLLCLEPLIVFISASPPVPMGAPPWAEGFYSGALLIVVSVAFLLVGLRGIVSGVNYPIASWLLAVVNIVLVAFGILLAIG